MSSIGQITGKKQYHSAFVWHTIQFADPWLQEALPTAETFHCLLTCQLAQIWPAFSKCSVLNYYIHNWTFTNTSGIIITVLVVITIIICHAKFKLEQV